MFRLKIHSPINRKFKSIFYFFQNFNCFCVIKSNKFIFNNILKSFNKIFVNHVI